MSAHPETDQSNVLPFRHPEATARFRAIRAMEQDRYALAHCAQLGFVPEKYWDDFLELADIIREQQR
jgi:hypothetical protein